MRPLLGVVRRSNGFVSTVGRACRVPYRVHHRLSSNQIPMMLPEKIQWDVPKEVSASLYLTEQLAAHYALTESNCHACIDVPWERIQHEYGPGEMFRKHCFQRDGYHYVYLDEYAYAETFVANEFLEDQGNHKFPRSVALALIEGWRSVTDNS